MSDFRSQGAPLPTDPDLLMSHGQQILKQGDQEAAAAAFERLLRIRPDWALAREFLVEALNQHSLALAGHERLEEALRVSQRALEADPNHIDALNIRGYVLMDLSRFSEAATCYEKAVAAEPSIAELWCSLGTALSRDRRLSEAETAYGRAIALSPRFALAVINRAHALVSLGRYADAVSAFEEALRLKPGDPHLKAALLTNRAHVCDWRDRNLLLADTAACFTRSDLTAQGIVLDAFASQILYDDPGLQRSAAEIFAARLYGPPHAWTGDRRASRDRIRIGYFSPDFGDHPIAHLMAGLFERHDRSRFEVCAFSLGPRSHNPWRTRIADGVEHFIDLADASGSEIMTAALQYELDIAVDLAGYTHGNHAELFARRIAPVQVGYLGYLGTLGAPFLDYLLADETIVPPDHQRFYAEKIVYLPSYQGNDDKQAPSDEALSRAGLGLPQDEFVFCSFNQTYKITPDVFDSWMRILSQVPGSVLWLFGQHDAAISNLQSEAAKRGIDPARLLFARRVSLEDHLARQKAADLFLDTHPYNAGATASNALRMSVPVLTRIGKSFPARMGASLLQALGLPELITHTPEAYEGAAIRLATQPDILADIKRKLHDNLSGSLLFDTERSVRALEAAFIAMHERA